MPGDMSFEKVLSHERLATTILLASIQGVRAVIQGVPLEMFGS